MRLHTGFTRNEFGRPTGAVLSDNVPAPGRRRPHPGRPAFRGALVLGARGTKYDGQATRARSHPEAVRASWAALTPEQRAERGRLISEGKARAKGEAA